MKSTPRKAFIASIRAGDYDEELDKTLKMVAKAVRARRQLIAEERVSTLAEGDRIRIIPGNIKPKYFIGNQGTIDSFDGAIVWVKLDTPIKRKTKTIGKVGVPADLVVLDE